MKHYLQITRPVNLVMMAVSMFMVRYALLQPIFEINGLRLHMDILFFSLIVLSIILLAAGGNVINDIKDIEADKINKPGVNKVGSELSLSNAWKYYYALTSIGLLMGFFINFQAGVPAYTLIHIFIGLSLWFYSNRLNSIPLVGNALVSTLIAILPWIVTIYDLPVALIDSINVSEVFILSPSKEVNISEYFTSIIVVILSYSLFAYVQNMARELTKDVIDYEGDHYVGYRTAPLAYGIPNTKKLLYITFIILLIIQLAFIALLHYNFPPANYFWFIFVGLCLVVPVFISFRMLTLTNNRLGYQKLSRWNKISQAIGMFTMFYFYFLNA